ncbi:hypothetical protein Mapa_013505 [Marchantia paleacea]|nr:hypothetical protein Mapa_013505 [Marchantia paleacea]
MSLMCLFSLDIFIDLLLFCHRNTKAMTPRAEVLQLKFATTMEMTMWLIMMAYCGRGVAHSLTPKPPSNFFVYIVRRFQSQGVNNTVVRIYPPGISAPLERQVQVSDNLIRAMSSNTSEELGTQRDIRVLGFLADHVLRAQATGVLDFNSTLYDGTLSFSGILTAGLLPPVDELTITGGTGVFRGASGHVISTALSYDIDSGIQKISLCRKLCHYD